jgi:hypothetical protein
MGSLKVAQAKIAAARRVDPWRFPLERVRGKIDYDGVERVTTQMLLDVLEVPQRSRRAGTYRHLAKIMAEMGLDRSASPRPDAGRLFGTSSRLLPRHSMPHRT